MMLEFSIGIILFLIVAYTAGGIVMMLEFSIGIILFLIVVYTASVHGRGETIFGNSKYITPTVIFIVVVLATLFVAVCGGILFGKALLNCT